MGLRFLHSRPVILAALLTFLGFCHLSSSFLLPKHHARTRIRSPPVSSPDSSFSNLAAELQLSPAQDKLRSLQDGKDRSGSFFIAQVSGRQHWMELGRFYDVYRLDVDIGKPITLNRVLLYKDTEGDFYWGHPFLEHVRVHATVLEHFRGPKVKSFKFKAKTKYRRLVGHRQEMTRIRIDRIELLDHKEDPTWTVNKDPLYALMKNVYAEKKCQGTNFAELAERVVYDDHYIPNPV